MKICAVVVWFNPCGLGNPVERIKSYSGFMGKVYIVDNSENDNSLLAREVENAEYVPLMKNMGIARALNVGCGLAIRDGFDFCMTMDQDSVWSADEIKKYLSSIELGKDDYQNFSPIIRTDASFVSTLGKIKRRILRRNLQVCDYAQGADRFITSGSVMALSAFKKVSLYGAARGGVRI